MKNILALTGGPNSLCFSHLGNAPALIKQIVSGARTVSLPTLALVEKKTEIIKYNE